MVLLSSQLVGLFGLLLFASPDTKELLLDAARSGDVAKLNASLTAGAPVDVRGEEGATPLMIAAARGHVAATKALIEHGADVNAQDSDNKLSPLMVAAFRGRLEIVRMLVEHGADVTLKDKDGANAFLYARVATPHAQKSQQEAVLEAVLQVLASKGGGMGADTSSAEGALGATLWIIGLPIPEGSCFEHLESPPCKYGPSGNGK